MFKLSFIKRTLPLALAFGLGLAMVHDVTRIASYEDTQSGFYDMAMKALSKGDAATGLKALGASINAYKGAERGDWFARLVLPPPDQELAALAYFQAANVLAQQDPQKAMAAYVQSLDLNNGELLVEGVTPRDDPAHQYGQDYCVAPSDGVAMHGPVTGTVCQLRRLQKEAEDTRNNMQVLLDQHPELKKMLQQGGKLPGGKGGPGQKGNGPKGNMPAKGQPANGASHDNPSAI